MDLFAEGYPEPPAKLVLSHCDCEAEREELKVLKANGELELK